MGLFEAFFGTAFVTLAAKKPGTVETNQLVVRGPHYGLEFLRLPLFVSCVGLSRDTSQMFLKLRSLSHVPFTRNFGTLGCRHAAGAWWPPEGNLLRTSRKSTHTHCSRGNK